MRNKILQYTARINSNKQKEHFRLNDNSICCLFASRSHKKIVVYEFSRIWIKNNFRHNYNALFSVRVNTEKTSNML